MPFIWVALYALAFSLTKALLFSPWQVSLVMGIYTALLLLWIWCSGWGSRIGLTAPDFSEKHDLLLLLPMLILAVHNFLFSDRPSAAAALLLALAAVTEEIFFRGFLLRFLMRCGARRAILFSAVLFALFHLANTASFYTLLQLLCALGAGLCFASAALVYKSILPGILCHVLINVTADGSSTGSVMSLLCAAAIMILSSCHFIRKINN